MQEFTMNQLKNSMNSVVVHPVPLFASSWVALFYLLRTSFMKSGSESEAESKIDGKGVDDTRH